MKKRRIIGLLLIFIGILILLSIARSPVLPRPATPQQMLYHYIEDILPLAPIALILIGVTLVLIRTSEKKPK